MNASLTLRRRLVTAFLAFLPPLASAQSYDFTGVFDPAEWTFTSGGDESSVTWNGTSSFTLIGSLLYNGSPTSTDLAVGGLLQNYRISFDWSFISDDPGGPMYDPVGFNSTKLSDDDGANTQSGNVSNAFVSSALQFYANSDNWNNATDGRSSLTISNFSYTLADPDDTGDGGGDGGSGGSGGGSHSSGSTAWADQSGDWATPANWDSGVPDATQQVNITEGSTVNITTAAEAHSVYLEASALNITGSGSLTQANPWGDFAADYGATLTVSGSDASWINASYFTLYNASATFDNGATVSTQGGTFGRMDDSVSTINVRNGATWSGGDISLGFRGIATLNIESGATVILGETLVGDYLGGRGFLNVTGAGTTLSTGFLKLGNFSRGEMTVSDGAVVTSTGAAIAYGSANGAGDVIGVATVTGAGSRWEIAANLGVSGYVDSSTYNTGTLTIADGGLVRIGATGAGTLDIAHGGTLHIGVGGSAGTLQAGTVRFTADSGTAAVISFDHTDDIVFSASITGYGVNPGQGRVSKSGSGVLTLTGENNYLGATAVNAGTLLVNGSLEGTAVTVADGATLGGSGSIEGFTTIQSGATLAAGNSPGTLTFTSGLALDGGALLDFELGAISDRIRVSGGVLSGPASGKITVNLFDSGGFTAGAYTLIDATGAELSSIGATSFELGSVIAGYTYAFSRSGDQFILTASAIPEPSAFAALLGLATLSVVVLRRNRRA